MDELSCPGHRSVAVVRTGEALKASKCEAHRKMRPPGGNPTGPREMTWSIGRTWTRGDPCSEAVLRAERAVPEPPGRRHPPDLPPPPHWLCTPQRGSWRTAGAGGDRSGAAPPVPIPNTVVKRPSADDTGGGTRWDNRSLPPAPAALPTRGRAVVARRAHNPEVAGSNPAPATSQAQGARKQPWAFCYPTTDGARRFRSVPRAPER